MDLQTIAQKSGLPIRLLRYVLDHDVLPGGPVPRLLAAKGQPRSLDNLESFAVVIAATLLEGGVRRATVKSYLAILCDLKKPLIKGLGDHVLTCVYTTKYPAIVRFADGNAVRVVLGDHDTWWQPSKAKPVEPRLLIELNLAVLRHKLFQR